MMSQQNDDSSKSNSHLSLKQSQFLSLRALGLSVAEAARHVGISRSTHYVWMHDPSYSIAHFGTIYRAITDARDQVVLALPDAVRCVMEAIANGDAKIALRLIEGMGILSAAKDYEAAGVPSLEEVEAYMDKSSAIKEAKLAMVTASTHRWRARTATIRTSNESRTKKPEEPGTPARHPRTPEDFDKWFNDTMAEPTNPPSEHSQDQTAAVGTAEPDGQGEVGTGSAVPPDAGEGGTPDDKWFTGSEAEGHHTAGGEELRSA